MLAADVMQNASVRYKRKYNRVAGAKPHKRIQQAPWNDTKTPLKLFLCDSARQTLDSLNNKVTLA